METDWTNLKTVLDDGTRLIRGMKISLGRAEGRKDYALFPNIASRLDPWLERFKTVVAEIELSQQDTQIRDALSEWVGVADISEAIATFQAAAQEASVPDAELTSTIRKIWEVTNIEDALLLTGYMGNPSRLVMSLRLKYVGGLINELAKSLPELAIKQLET